MTISMSALNRIIYSAKSNLLHQLKSKVNYECPYTQCKFLKINSKRTYSSISRHLSRYFAMILLLNILTFYILFSISISPSLIASQVPVSISDTFTPPFIN